MNFWNQLFNRGLVYVTEVKELPSPLHSRTVYIVIEGKQKIHAALICPCGCRSTILLNLLKDSYPYWKISKGNIQGLTISPSIWKTSGCKSHFFIRRGKIIWAGKF